MTSSPRVALITIGTELILGRVPNTNAGWLAQRIVQVGGHVSRVTTVRDHPEDIVASIAEAIRGKATHIITTGGLGPTPDDLTVATVAEMLVCPIVEDEGLLAHFRRKLGLGEGEPLSSSMRKVATIPEKGSAGPNPSGWGHCIQVSHAGVTLFILPGPPREVEALFPIYIEPALRVVV